MWLNQSDVDSWVAAFSFYPAQYFAVDDRYFVVYRQPVGKSVLIKKVCGHNRDYPKLERETAIEVRLPDGRAFSTTFGRACDWANRSAGRRYALRG
jgi:hypothetical protein